MRGFGIRGRVQRWSRWQLAAIGAFALGAIVVSVVVPALMLGDGNWASLPAELATALARPTSAASQSSVGSEREMANGTPGAAPSPTTGTGAASGTTRNGCAITAQELAGERHLLALLNAHRAAAGVRPLALDAALSGEAREHSCDMQRHHRLSHTGSDGSTPFQRIRAAGVTYRAAGENIGETVGYALTAGLDRDDRDMMAEPLAAGNHHWNIVNPAYTRVGLGVIYVGTQLYFTEDFVG
jgi:uncharacterized protein YkwD